MSVRFDVTGFRRRLLRWYAADHREMPWRVEPGRLADPYRVLVSELMLQQTQVATVIGYFHRFLEAFPTLASLAAADEQRVLRLWQGLGYYRRARLLHAASKKVMAEFGGSVPVSVEDLLKLPGVGRYTAGAVASIAHGVKAPVVDGNVSRVMARVLGDRGPVDGAKLVARAWERMGQLVVTRGRYGPGDVNQAVMELGATICAPRDPRCAACPVSRLCRAYASGDAGAFGRKEKRKAPAEVTHYVLAVRRRGCYLFERRGGEGLWAGMWQLPTVEEVPGSPPVMRRWMQTRGVSPHTPQKVGRFTHATTHRRITFEVHEAMCGRGRMKNGSARWRRLDDIDDLPMSNAQKRAVAMVKAAHPDPLLSPVH